MRAEGARAPGCKAVRRSGIALHVSAGERGGQRRGQISNRAGRGGERRQERSAEDVQDSHALGPGHGRCCGEVCWRALDLRVM
eukprot:3475095-Rhodomonas_salina.1